MTLYEKNDNENRDRHQSCRRHHRPHAARLCAGELEDGDRCRVDVGPAEDECQLKIVPGEDEAEDRRGNDTRPGKRQDDASTAQG